MESSTIACPGCKADIMVDSVFCVECGTNVQMASNPAISASGTVDVDISGNLLQKYRNLSETVAQMSEAETSEASKRAHMESLRAEYEDLNRASAEASRQVQFEKEDVDRLNSFTWTSIKAKLSGSKDQQLSKEEQEYFRAVEHDSFVKQNRDAMYERYQGALKEWNEAKDFLDQKNRLKEELKKLIRTIGEEMSDPEEDRLEKAFAKLENKRLQVKQELGRINNGRSYANSAIDRFRKALDSLHDAKGHADWDTFFGGGHFVDHMKRSNVSDARNLAFSANNDMDRASKILNKGVQYAQVEQSDYWADTFFDNIFTDMHAREKIQRSIRSVQESLRDAQDLARDYDQILGNIKSELKGLNGEFYALEKQLEEIRIGLIEGYMARNK